MLLRDLEGFYFVAVIGCVHFRDVFCAGRVPEEDLRRTLKACGGAIQTSVSSLTDTALGTCQLFQEEQIGGERWAGGRGSLVGVVYVGGISTSFWVVV